MKIATYNVNGFKSAIKDGVLDWIVENDLDIVCVQETKSHPGSLPLLLLDSIGYKHHWHPARRKGYSGVATFSKVEPTKVYKGIGLEEYDVEGRVIRTDFDDVTIFNCYFPNGGSGAPRQAYKMQFWMTSSNASNVCLKNSPTSSSSATTTLAHRKIDIFNADRNNGNSGFMPEEREWFDGWLNCGIRRFIPPHESRRSQLYLVANDAVCASIEQGLAIGLSMRERCVVAPSEAGVS